MVKKVNYISITMAVFSLLGALDRILGGRFGLAKEFEKGILLAGSLALSMIGMVVISPLIADALEPAFGFVHSALGIDPSVIPASLFANDMGGAPLANQVAADPALGRFNALVVSSMMGCTISFTIPCALGLVSARRRELLLGMLCGIVTIPLGCFAGGMVMGLNALTLMKNLLPLAAFSAIIAAGLALCPDACVKIFGAFGTLIRVVITIGLGLALFTFMTGIELVPGLATLEEGALLVLNACAVMTGAFPLLFVVSKALKKPMAALGRALRIGEPSVMGFLSTLANSITTFEAMDSMDRRGALLNSAFAVSAAFTLADHLAFTLAYDPGCLAAMIAGKLTAGLLAVLAAMLVGRRIKEEV